MNLMNIKNKNERDVKVNYMILLNCGLNSTFMRKEQWKPDSINGNNLPNYFLKINHVVCDSEACTYQSYTVEVQHLTHRMKDSTGSLNTGPH